MDGLSTSSCRHVYKQLRRGRSLRQIDARTHFWSLRRLSASHTEFPRYGIHPTRPLRLTCAFVADALLALLPTLSLSIFPLPPPSLSPPPSLPLPSMAAAASASWRADADQTDGVAGEGRRGSRRGRRRRRR